MTCLRQEQLSYESVTRLIPPVPVPSLTSWASRWVSRSVYPQPLHPWRLVLYALRPSWGRPPRAVLLSFLRQPAMSARSGLLQFSCSVPFGGGRGDRYSSVMEAEDWAASHRPIGITARSIRFLGSSRILPGHGYAMKAFIVVSGMCSMCFPIRRANTAAK